MSTAVVGFAIAIVLNTVPLSTRTYQWSTQASVAASLADRELSAIAVRGFAYADEVSLASNSPKPALLDSSTPVSTNTYAFTNIGSATNSSVAQMLPNGVGTLTIENVSGDITRLTVTITWKGPRGTTETYKAGLILGNF